MNDARVGDCTTRGRPPGSQDPETSTELTPAMHAAWTEFYEAMDDAAGGSLPSVDAAAASIGRVMLIEERADVVWWLRELAKLGEPCDANQLADRIEAGEHARATR